MQPENPQIYYMVVDEQSTGPFSLDEITLHPKLTPETLVWKPGIENWMPAKTFPELDVAFRHSQPQTPPDYHQQNREPHHSDYNRFADNPQYSSNHTYHNNHRYYERNDRYQNGYRPGFRTNWLPWAIVATVVGFFTSCIGAIFGIIAIVQANKANTLYAQGYDREADAANSNARIMTIIGLILAGLGIIATFWIGSFFTNFANFSYL